MRVLCLALCFLTLGEARYQEDEKSVRWLMSRWKQEYNVHYKSPRMNAEKFQTFRENIKYINWLNEVHNGKTEFALNKFADLSPDEFKSKILMSKRQPPVFENTRKNGRFENVTRLTTGEIIKAAPNSMRKQNDLATRAYKEEIPRYIRGSSISEKDLPESFDWTTQGRVTPVKDQGDVGTCWAFSTVENIEGQWIQAGQPMTNLSVEQVVECDGTSDLPRNNTHADCGVFGGWPYLAYQYVIKAGGLQTWEDYWYCCGLGGAPGTCDVCPPAGYNWTRCGPPVPYCNMTQSCAVKINPKKFVPELKVVDWKAIDPNETTIAEQLMNIGPLSVALDATLLQFYHKGVFDPIFCSKTNLDHAVLVVGFGKEKDLFSTKPFWKVKNSWGEKWGENGYFRILRGSGTCGINTQVTTAVLQKPR